MASQFPAETDVELDASLLQYVKGQITIQSTAEKQDAIISEIQAISSLGLATEVTLLLVKAALDTLKIQMELYTSKVSLKGH